MKSRTVDHTDRLAVTFLKEYCYSMWYLAYLISDNLKFATLCAAGYLSCCRFLDDSQIVTSSGDTTW